MDVSKLCRSCMEEVATWECEDADQKTMEMFIFCTNIEVPKEDKLPKHFCYHCTVLLESSYTYIKKAKRVNQKLKKIAHTSFVDKLLSKTNSVAFEKSPDVNSNVNNFVETENHMNGFESDSNNADNYLDHDIFDEDDEKCLSEFKSIPDKDIKEEIETEHTGISAEVKSEDLDTNHTTELNNKTIKHSKKGYRSKKCNICKKSFTRKGWYTRHMKLAHTEKAEVQKELAKLKNKDRKNTYTTKEPGHSKDVYKCRVCDMTFSSKGWRTKHLNEVHSQTTNGEKTFLCPHCPKTFTKYSHMYYHSTSHSVKAKHPCPTCGKEYRIRKELEQHIRTHLKDRPYACDKCDMRFKVKGILVMHLKMHDGVRPFLCSVCGRSFIQSGNLESHMRVHTGEKPFSCGQCSFRSTSRVSLKRHELRHKGERPFPCTYCPKRFYESCSLVRHVRSHTRERPYRCPYCKRDFYDSGKRRRHFIMTHKMAPDEIPPMDKEGGTIERIALNRSRRVYTNE